MAHFAKVVNGTVEMVIVATQDVVDSFRAQDGVQWVQTSYNTRGGVHFGEDGSPDDGAGLRANYAGVGYTYDAVHDVFYAPKPYPSWIISAPDWIWRAPIAPPGDCGAKLYRWDEAEQRWLAAS